MIGPSPLRWSVTVDAYGEITGPEPWTGVNPREPNEAAGLVFHGVGTTPEEAIGVARARWRDQLPWLLGLLEQLERAESSGHDVDDGELVGRLRLLLGADPVPRGWSAVPASVLPAWVYLVRQIVRAHSLDWLEEDAGAAG